MLGETVAELQLALKDIERLVDCYDAQCIKELDGWVKKEIEKNSIVFTDGLLEDCYNFNELYESLPR